MELFAQLRGFKLVITLYLVFRRIEIKDKTKYDSFYSSSESETEIIINKSDIKNVFKSIYTTIIANMQKSLGQGSEWITDSVIEHTISITNYNPLSGSSYIKLHKELEHTVKSLINVQNTDYNKCFKWCLVKNLNPADHHPARTTKLIKILQRDMVLNT